MTNKPFNPASWLVVFLSLIPGLLLFGGRLGISETGNQMVYIVSWLTYLALLVVGVIIYWLRQRRFPEWALLPAGLLAWMAVYLSGTVLAEQWNTFGLLKPFSNARESGIFLLQALVTIVLFSILLRGQRIPLAAWLATGAILVINIFIARDYMTHWAYRPLATRLVQYLTVSGISPVEGFMLVALGLLAARQHGLRGLLVFVGGYLYLLLDSDYFSGPGFDQWVGYTAFSVSLVVIYLLLMPLAILRARTRREMALATFIPFGVFQLMRTAVPDLVLQGRISIPWHSISLIFFLALAWVLYEHGGASQPHQEAADLVSLPDIPAR